MYILLAGVNHKSTPLEIREKFAFNESDLQIIYQQFKQIPQIEGVVVLTTCNRTEIYASARNIEQGQESIRVILQSYTGLDHASLNKYVYQPNCFNAIEHLFRVSAGLDSMIIGETQILGQVKDAYIKAMEYDGSDTVLNHLFQKAIYVGKKVRSETSIDQHPVSISYASVELARRLLGTLDDKSVLVVGAGETGELTTRHLLAQGVKSVIVSNRSYDKAVELAAQFDGRAVRLDALEQELRYADIVISCTAASHPVIRFQNCEEVLRDRRGRKILFIDIAVPRDVEPSLSNVDGVYIYDIDMLQDTLDASYQERKKAAGLAEIIIQKELIEFNQWLATLYVVPVISALKSFGENVKQQELKRAFNRLGKVSDREQKIIVEMSNAIVNQLLRFPVENLKEMAISNQGHLYAELTKKLFGLQVDHEEQKMYESFEVGYKG